MNTNAKPFHILRYESAGFGLLIALSWLNEFLNMPRLIFGGAATGDWHEAVVETLTIFCVWAIVHLMTRQLLKRLYYLEGFFRICAWCRKVGQDGQWVTLETYLAERFDIQTSHGICPECAEKLSRQAGS